MEHTNLIQKVAGVMARQYGRKFPWLGAQDVYQEAALAVMLALRTADPSRPTFESYLYTAAAQAVIKLGCHNGSPVSGPMSRPGKTLGLVAVQLDDHLADTSDSPFEQLHQEQVLDQLICATPPKPTRRPRKPVEVVSVETQCCSKCIFTKPAAEFYVDRGRRSGLTSWCRVCAAAHEKAKRDAKSTG